MVASHTFDLKASSAFVALEALFAARLQLSDEAAVAEQRAFEREVLAGVLKLGAELVGADLSRLDVRVPGVVVEGESYRPKQLATCEYTTLLGAVKVERMVYESRGGHGEKRCVPLEMRLGFVDGHWTPEAAYVGCLFMASTTSREAAELLASVSALQPSSCHLDRLPKHFNTLWENDRAQFETQLQELEKLPSVDDVAIILVSLDGVMVPMKDATSKGEAEEANTVGYKEAGSATFALINAKGERLHTIKLGRMPEHKKVTLKDQMAAELKRLDSEYVSAKFVAVADGAKENWRILNELNNEIGLEMEFILDYFHAMEHIAQALNQTPSTSEKQRDEELNRWRRTLLEEDDGLNRLISTLSTSHRLLRGKKREELGREINYLNSHRQLMRYPEFRRLGFPIGSGIQEAACKTLVSQRMKRSGMSWKYSGGQAILTLRSLEQSGRLPLAWTVMLPRLLQPYSIDAAPARKRPSRIAA